MGLIGMAARTAVVAGTATTVSNRVSRRQARRWGEEQDYGGGAQQPQYQEPVYQAPPPPPADDGDDMIEQLTKLGKLHDAGILTDEEFSAQKAKILG
jgi:hypothetical protein